MGNSRREIFNLRRRELEQYAWHLRSMYYREHEARVLFLEIAQEYMPDRVSYFEDRVFNRVWSQPRTRFRLNEVGNAERFVAQHGNDIRYCHKEKGWYIWDGRRWAKDETQAIIQLGLETVRSIAREAESVDDGQLRERMIRHSRECESKSRINGLVKFAETIPAVAISPDDLDTDPWLLNCENGTLDLRTGSLLPHSREHLITKYMPIPYNPNAKCRKWDSFIHEIMGKDLDLIDFLQRVVGYSLTGSTEEKCLFLLVGPTNTGKTTFAETLRKVLGDNYAKVTGFETFVYSRNRSTIRNDLARLKGARLVTASEVRPDDKFDEQLVKLTTGQDTYIARYLYQEFQEIRPEFKIILTANHKPKIEGVDDAIWNRFHVIPFKVSIPQREQDRELGGKLMKEVAGILAWAVRGCHEWQELGALNPPARVVRALKVYQQECDPIFGFLRDRCYTFPRATETSARLYTEYMDWCSKHQEEPLKAKKFGSLLSQRDGIESVRNLTSDEGKQARGYRGIVLKSTMAKHLSEEIAHSYETRNNNAK